MTRLYLPSSGAAAVAPAFDPLWTQTTGADRLRLSRSKRGTALADKAVSETSALALNVLMRQYVSDPLGAQVISGTVKIIARTLESATAADFRSQLGVRVVSNDGATVRGTLLAPDTVGTLTSEWGTGAANRKFPKSYPTGGAGLNNIQCQEDDRLVLEVGYRSHNTSTTSRTGTIRFGDPTTVGDCLENETDSTDLCPWMELSHDILWLHNPTRAWIFPGFEVVFPLDEQTGVVDRSTVLAAPSGITTKRVMCGDDSWEVAAGEKGDKMRQTVDVPTRLAVG